MKFNYRTPICELYGSYIDSIPQGYDWGDGYLSDWISHEAAEIECPYCDKLFYSTSDVMECPRCHYELENDRLDDSGPMMGYYYPVEVNRVGGVAGAALAIARLPLCVVEWLEDGLETGSYALALTGGGMDLSWEIIEGYMRLGYLPPFHFVPPPAMAGKRLDARHKWLLAGCNATLSIFEMRIKSARRDVRYLRKTLRDRK